MADITQVEFRGNASIGVFAVANDHVAVVPLGVDDDVIQRIQTTLEVPVVQTLVSNISLVGTMTAMGPDSILVPPFTREEEIKPVLEVAPNLQLVVVPTKLTALGNVMCISKNAALVNPDLEDAAKEAIADELSIEVIDGYIAGSRLVGAALLRTKRGILTHPLIQEEEIEIVEASLHRNSDITTVNRGIPYPRTGMIANSKGVVAGTDTTGPELMRIFEIFLS